MYIKNNYTISFKNMFGNIDLIFFYFEVMFCISSFKVIISITNVKCIMTTFEFIYFEKIKIENHYIFNLFVKSYIKTCLIFSICSYILY